jgi:ribosomal protein S12 methylthiotransferase
MKFYITEDDMCTTQKLNLARVQKWIIANGHSVTDDANECDRLLCMTCNGWSLLENASYDRINKYKGDFADKMIVVGCINDAHPDKVKEIWKGPTVKTSGDETFSFADIENLFPEFKTRLSEIPAQSIFRRKEDYRDYNLSKRFINISEGCTFDCSFCTHKPGLGKPRSRSADDILKQIGVCVKEDVKIINLMGMETSLWGRDIGSTYPELLRNILNFNDSYEVHVAQFQPTGIYLYGQELLDLFKNKRVSDIQTPMQSTSTRVMKMMRRKEYSKYVGPFLKELRAENKRTILRTDIIIGWPTETVDERLDSLKFAGTHFDEVALYTIELHPDRPAWKYHDQAFSESELSLIRKDSINFLNDHFPEVVVHCGQQDDQTMHTAEQKRKTLRQKKSQFN